MGCIATALLDLARMPVAISDFPAGALLVGLAWRFGHLLSWFGVRDDMVVPSKHFLPLALEILTVIPREIQLLLILDFALLT